MLSLEHFLILSGFLFAIGLYGVLARRNGVLVLMSIELMLQAVNVNFVAFAMYLDPLRAMGQVLAVFVICIAAAEVALALAILLRIYRNRASINLDDIDLMKW
jgi:NADH:ubiquinone oxidoreductase subunit K